MFRTALALLLTAAALGVVSPAHASVPAAPAHTLAVSGSGVSMYPTFDAATQRYAVTTADATGGTVTVSATTSDPDGSIWVDGRRAKDGKAQVTGLGPGDEISVFFVDSSGTEVHSLVYLPPGFPTLEVTTRKPGIAPGYVGLTLSQWNTPTPNFEAVVDISGVPVYVRSSATATFDLKRQPNGHYSVSRASTDPARTGWEIVELDSAFSEVARHRTVGHLDTDSHDSVLLPNGNRILLGYEPNATSGKTDALIQEVTAAGVVVFEWNSAALAGETMVAGADYAHVNSVSVMDDGDLLVSFRHLSTVLKIARSAHDGFQPGDIVWKLGGRDSTFAFDDPADGGPCAQHAASELDNGDILIFDNGSGWPSANMCIDPTDRTGPSIARHLTRVAQYSLDAGTGTATLVWEWSAPGNYGFFAGSAQRLPNGHTVVGWAGVRGAVATEVSPGGETLWEIKDAAASGPAAAFYSTYRALKFDVPDTIPPEVEVRTPAPGASYAFDQNVTASLRCTDRGGSSLRTCGTTVRSGDRLDTSTPGRHTVTVAAKDGDGNTTTVTRTYTVGQRPPHPDAQIRKLPSGAWVGGDVIGGSTGQLLRQPVGRRPGSSVRARIRVQNDGTGAAVRFTLHGTRGGSAFRVAYFAHGRDITRRVTAGSFRTDRLDPREAFVLTVRVTRTRAATSGQTRTIKLRAASVADPRRTDAVATVVRASR